MNGIASAVLLLSALAGLSGRVHVSQQPSEAPVWQPTNGRQHTGGQAASATRPQQPSQAPAWQPTTRGAVADHSVKIIPWIEVNLRDRKYFELAVAGLEVWRSVTDTAIVSTVPGMSDLYPRLGRRVPGMRILPGMKTHPRLGFGGFDSPEGWRLLAHDIVDVCATSGEKRVVLENESALRGYDDGTYALDLERLRVCLEQLPQDIDLWWYPGFTAESTEALQRQRAMLRVIEAACHPRFVTFHLQSPAAIGYHWSRVTQTEFKALASRPAIPIVYLGTFEANPTVRYWPCERTPEVLERVQVDCVLFYPDAVNWIEAARQVSAVLRKPVGEAP